MKEEILDQIETWVEDIGVGMLVTHGNSDNLSSRPMEVVTTDLENGFFYFFSDSNTIKITEIAQNSGSLISFSCPKKKIYLSVEGNAFVINDKNEFQKHWNDKVSLWYPQGIDDEKLRLISFKIEDIEFWSPEDNNLFRSYKILLSNILGERPKVDQHKKIDF